MKFQARFSGDGGGPAVPIEVAATTPEFRVLLEGRLLSGEAALIRPGVWSLVFSDGRQWEVSLEP